MAIKIPKDIDIPIPSVGEPRSLLDTTRQDRINFEGLTADITNVANKIHSHNRAIENERIRNKATKTSSQMLLDIDNFVQQLEKGDKNGNPYNQNQIEQKIINYEKNYLSRNYGVDSKAVTGRYFEDTQGSKDYFASLYYTNLGKFRNDAHGIVKERILSDTKLRFEDIKTLQREKKITAQEGMWDFHKIDRKEIEDAFLVLSAAGDKQIDLGKELEVVDNRYWTVAVVGPDEHRVDAFGNKVVDNLAVVAKLKAKDEDGSYTTKKFQGKILDKDRRKKLITHFQDQAQNQTLTENRHIKRTNDNIVADSVTKILKNDLDINDIEGLETVGPEKELIKNDLKLLRKRVILNLIPKESSIQAYKHINNGILDGSITSMHQDFIVEGEPPDTKNPSGWSIIDRLKLAEGATFGAVSDEDGIKFKGFLDQKYSYPLFILNMRKFNDWVGNYENYIIGTYQSNMGMTTVAGRERWEATKRLLEKKFLDGLEKGDTIEELINPDHPKYLWKSVGGINNHIPSWEIEQNEVKNFMQLNKNIVNKNKEFIDTYGPPPFNPRKFNTIEQWKSSDEYQNWLNDVEKQKKWKEWLDKQAK